jgi:hypothetical protein
MGDDLAHVGPGSCVSAFNLDVQGCDIVDVGVMLGSRMGRRPKDKVKPVARGRSRPSHRRPLYPQRRPLRTP